MSTVTNICTQSAEIEELCEGNIDEAHAKVYESVLENTANNLYESSK